MLQCTHAGGRTEVQRHAWPPCDRAGVRIAALQCLSVLARMETGRRGVTEAGALKLLSDVRGCEAVITTPDLFQSHDACPFYNQQT